MYNDELLNMWLKQTFLCSTVSAVGPHAKKITLPTQTIFSFDEKLNIDEPGNQAICLLKYLLEEVGYMLAKCWTSMACVVHGKDCNITYEHILHVNIQSN